MRKEQITFNRYLDNHPSVRDTAVATFQGIIRTVPLPSPAATPRIDDHYKQDATSLASIPEQILRREQLGDTGRARSRESPVPPEDLSIDKVERDDRRGYSLCAQHETPRRSYTPELSDRGTPSLTGPCDSNLEHNPVDLNDEQVYHHPEPPHRTEAKIERDAEDEQAGHNGSQEEPGRSVALPPASPNTSGELEPPSPTKPRASKRKRKSGSWEGQHGEQGKNLDQDSPHPDPLPLSVTRRVPGIASFETIVFLRDRLQLLSDSASGLDQSLIHDHQSWREASMPTLPRRQYLEML